MPGEKRATRSGGQFVKKCVCAVHNIDNNDLPSEKSCYKLNGSDKKLKREQVEHLVSAGYVIRKQTRYGQICKACANAIFNPVSSATTKRKAKDQSTSGTSSSSHKKQQTGITNTDIAAVCSHIAGLVKKKGASLYKLKRPTTDSLLSYSPKAWLEARPPELIQLVASICGVDFRDDKKCYVLTKAVEQIYHIRNYRLILPLSFRESLLIYSWTKSKQAVTLQCSNAPSSSYTTVNRFLVSEGGDEIHVPPGVVRCAYDNNQIIGKTHIITGDNKVPTSIMTSTSYTQLNESDTQEKHALKPGNWMWKEDTIEEKDAMLQAHSNPDHIQLLRRTRNAHIKYYLQIIHRQQRRDDNNQCTDYVDGHIKKVHEVKEQKICTVCGSENDKDYRVCRNVAPSSDQQCGGPLINPPTPNIKNAATTSEPATTDANVSYKSQIPVTSNEARVIPGEPEFVNPNSFQTIVKVIQNLGQRAGIDRYGGTGRQWIFLECDGLPYKIMRDLTDYVFICSRCNTSFYGADKLNSDDHRCFTLYGNQPLIREFDWLVPVMGLLHLEMNSAKSFLKLNWDIFVSDLAFAIGFKSPKSQEYCKKGSNHHKTWDLLQILYISLTRELLLPYVREINGQPTVQGYWDWCESNEDVNYKYIQLMTLTYLHALMVFWVGVRHNDIDAIFAGRIKFKPVFYAQNHPKYQDILYRDMHDQVTMPPGLKRTLHETFTFSRIGNEGHYQGGDANLEEINKDAKAHITNIGVPNEEQWKTVFRNLEKMKEIREATIRDAGVSQSTPRSARKLSLQAIGRTRVAIRKSRYLMEPKEVKVHKSIDGRHQLNQSLENFAANAEAMCLKYIHARLDGNHT